MSRRPLTVPTRKPVTLAAIHPNCGTEAAYRRKLEAMVAAMHKSLVYWRLAAYRANPVEMAQDDDSPAIGGPERPVRPAPARLSHQAAARSGIAGAQATAAYHHLPAADAFAEPPSLRREPEPPREELGFPVLRHTSCATRSRPGWQFAVYQWKKQVASSAMVIRA